jgi:hypothetical protein
MIGSALGSFLELILINFAIPIFHVDNFFPVIPLLLSRTNKIAIPLQ